MVLRALQRGSCLLRLARRARIWLLRVQGGREQDRQGRAGPRKSITLWCHPTPPTPSEPPHCRARGPSRSTPSGDPCTGKLAVQCSACPTVSTDRRSVRVTRLSRIPSLAARSPWSWPIVPLAAIAAIGQWGSVTAAAGTAAGFAAVGIGVAIGMAVSTGHVIPQDEPETQSDENQSGMGSPDPPGGESTDTDTTDARLSSPRIADLRGARLTNAMLVRADLRQADLRGATLRGANLSGADLTGARLGPLEDNPPGHEPG